MGFSETAGSWQKSDYSVFAQRRKNVDSGVSGQAR